MAARKESLICALCLDLFKSPKLLTCHHTFCEHCLNDLASHHPGGTFPCPSCRVRITVPPGGVSSFQTNFYINPEDLERARSKITCPKHSQHDRDLFCVKCDLPICFQCKLTKHEGHTTQDLKEAAPSARDQLDKDKSRLKSSVSNVKKQKQLATQEQQAVKDKHAALVTHIRNRQATLKAAVDKYTEDVLASLDKVTGDITNTLQADLRSLQQNLQELTKLQQQVQQALDSGMDFTLVTVAKEMRCGRGSDKAVEKLTTKNITTIFRPVLHYNSTPDTTLQRMRDYMGSVTKMEMKMPASQETMEERFRCREDTDTDVCQVCPMTDDSVYISYEPYMLRNDACSELFNAAGKVQSIIKCDTPGRNTMVRIKNGACMYVRPSSRSVCTYAKTWDSDMMSHFRLDNNLAGEATVYISTIVSDDPLKTENKEIITLHCAAHRAFDVSSNKRLFVVLEEGKTPEFQRRVQLYRCFGPKAIVTYRSPVTPFQPSDVCFYKDDRGEALLVADELNDAIHVVALRNAHSGTGRRLLVPNEQDAQGSELTWYLDFKQYLIPGCPLLVQPTALNTDTRDRLWVACRGGRILTCTPKLQLTNYFKKQCSVS